MAETKPTEPEIKANNVFDKARESRKAALESLQETAVKNKATAKTDAKGEPAGDKK